MKGFAHTTPVFKIYKVAAAIAESVQENGQSIKEIVFSHEYSRLNVKHLYALVVETLQHESILSDMVRESRILEGFRMNPWLAKVLIAELLWGKKKFPPNKCMAILRVLNLEPEFKAILEKAVLDGTHVDEPRINKAFIKPRYVRVNTLKMSVDDAVEAFKGEGWTEAYPEDPQDYASFLSKIANIGKCEFIRDFHIPEVLAFPPRTELFRHKLHISGHLVLQDKARCLPAFLLDPKPGSVVLDMCAAPGIKTIQLAAITKNQGKLYAVESSPLRHQTLIDFAQRHGAEISPIKTEASTLTSSEMPNIEYILVARSPPSSKTRGALQRPASTKPQKKRIRKIAAFQASLLKRALTEFPSVKRVVYSTCSKNVEENEQVVEKVLKTVNPDPANPNYKIADVLTDSWLSRGSSDFAFGPKCLSKVDDEDEDLTKGFFLAVFERIESGDLELKGIPGAQIGRKKTWEKTGTGKRKKVRDTEENWGLNEDGNDKEKKQVGKEGGKKKKTLKRKREGTDLEKVENLEFNRIGNVRRKKVDANLGIYRPGTDNDEAKMKKKKIKDLSEDGVGGGIKDGVVKEKLKKKKWKIDEDDVKKFVKKGKGDGEKRRKLEKGETLKGNVNDDAVRRMKKKRNVMKNM